jgi:hypothetical protein
MKRKTALLAALNVFSVLVLLAGTAAWSQGTDSHPALALPNDIVGPQLIAWSEVQKPQPLGDSSPARPTQAADNSAEQAIGPETRTQPATQTFTGTIVKDGGRYVLKASSNVYELDDQDRSKKYEGKQVRVKGVLDAKGNDVHVVDIELIS